ncbi:MAG TPA: TatD family hydrolase [Candidatus Saccharimonadales bacterium]|nr:TatD family hydrolase [Candidatus Saccharimonadales bacterium]
MLLVDTHCHIHEAVRKTTPVYDKWHEKGDIDPDTLILTAKDAGVTKLVCVGTTLDDSELAIEFVQDRPECWASIGIHPHEAAEAMSRGRTLPKFAQLAIQPKVVAVGECGLDYFYNHSPRDVQLKVLQFQLELASAAGLPVIFHVREAFDDFWPLYEQYKVPGVLHSFTDSRENMERAVEQGLYIGANGIATFTKNPKQLQMYRTIPLQNLLLETDAPFLTPTPYRGTINEPKHVRTTAEFLASLRGESVEGLATTTSQSAQKLFGI